MPNPISNDASYSPGFSAPDSEAASGLVCASPAHASAKPAPNRVDLDQGR